MDNKKKSIVLIIAIIVVFALASVAYNYLKVDAPTTSFVPNVKSEKVEKIIANANLNANEENDSKLNTEVVKSPVDTAKKVDNQSETSPTIEENTSLVATTDAPKEAVSSTDNSSLMPDIPIKMLDGTESTFWKVVPKGKPVVINLFASWCPPCKAEMPEFVKTREEYKDKVTFIFFDSFDGTRETETTLNKFVDSYFTDKDTLIVLDPGYLSYIFNTNSIPVTILLNDKGEIVNGFTGSISKTTLTTAIAELLK
ncbi:MAG: TlpA family protein disulfide reductase [Spirochaetaceae bacterium]|nr:TlpA family protein disulfide reductase [Spirochaetaceae bacterium]